MKQETFTKENDSKEDKYKGKKDINISKGTYIIDRFKNDNIKLTEGQRIIINKLCNTDELHDLFLIKFYNEEESMGGLLTKFRLFKLREGFGQDIKVLDIEEAIFRKNWTTVISLLEDVFQEELSFGKIKILLRNLAKKRYNIDYIMKKHRNHIYENFLITVK